MMTNKLGKEIKLYNAKELDLDLKYEFTTAAIEPRKDYFSHYLCPFVDIPPRPGIYIYIFPDGFYLGQAKNLENRFTEHFYAFYSKKCKDWHSTFGLKSWKAAKYFLLDYCIYRYMEVDEDKLDLYEQTALAKIVQNNMTEKYYNTIFYKKEENEK